MQVLLTIARAVGAPAQILTLLMLVWTTIGHRVWARQRRDNNPTAPRNTHVTWRLNAALVTMFVPFMVYVTMFAGRNTVVICVMTAAVIASCLHTAYLSYARYNTTFAGFMVGVALLFFGYGGVLIGGPLWTQAMAASLMMLGILGYLLSILVPERTQRQTVNAA